MERVCTTETRLAKGTELVQYLNAYVLIYNEVFREMWHDMTAKDFPALHPKVSNYVSDICAKHNLLKRTVNSIRKDIDGRKNSYRKLKIQEEKQLKQKISKQAKKVAETKKTVDKLKKKARDGKATEKDLKKLRASKSSLYYQRNRLNQMNQRHARLNYELKNNVYSIGFGSKTMFRKQHRLEENGYRTHEKWHNDYWKARDKNIYYLGSKDETAGNQLCQLTYDAETNSFNLSLRIEDKKCGYSKEHVEENGIRFKYRGDKIAEILEANKTKRCPQALSFRFVRRGNAWYLQAMFTISNEMDATRSNDGVVGIDYNEGFLVLSETDMVTLLDKTAMTCCSMVQAIGRKQRCGRFPQVSQKWRLKKGKILLSKTLISKAQRQS